MTSISRTNPGVYITTESLVQMRFLAKDLNLVARKRSLAMLDGAVRTRYRGRGMEFSEVRPYQAGDDIRTIDWRVTARMQAPYTKLFQEERERPIFVLVDQRSSMFFGSSKQFKSVYAAKLAATVAWTANNHNDRIGALVFGDREQRDIRAKRSKHAVLDLINQLVAFNHLLQSPFATSGSMDLNTMLTETSRIARPGSLVILLSDFHDFESRCKEPLAHLGKTSDVLAMHIFDPLERQLPPVSQLMVSNGRTRTSVNALHIGQAFTQDFDARQGALRQTCLDVGVQYVRADMTLDVNDFASELFGQRKGKKGKKTSQAPSGAGWQS